MKKDGIFRPFFMQKSLDLFDLHDIVRCGLVYEVVEPVSEEQGGVTAPGAYGRLLYV